MKVPDVFKYALLAASVFAVVLSAITLLPNLSLIAQVAKSEIANSGDLLALMFNLSGSLKTNFTAASAMYATSIAFLFALNITLWTYYIRRNKESAGGSGKTSVLGLLLGFLGIGCSSCGSFAVFSALSFFGAGGLLSFLPFGGKEFGFLAILLLCLSAYFLITQIKKPRICKT